MDERVAQLIRQGQQAAQDGNMEMARNYLQASVDLDRTNPTAWLWLAGVLEDPAAVRNALEQVLLLDPGNIRAEQGLAQLGAQYPSAPAMTVIYPEPEEDELEPEPDPVPMRGAGTGMLGTSAGAMTIEQELRASLQPAPTPVTTSSSLATVGVPLYSDTAPTGNYTTAAGENDTIYRVLVIVLLLTFILGLIVFGLILLRVI